MTPTTPPPTVLVVARHGGYALELRRAGLVVVEDDDVDDTVWPQVAACVIDAVGAEAPAPVSWSRLEPMLTADGAPPVVAVVSHRPPRWLTSLTSSAVLVSAPISGRVLVQHVATAIARSTTVVLPAMGHHEEVIDLSIEEEPVGAPVVAPVIDLVDDLDREPVGVHRSEALPLPVQSRPTHGDGGAHGLSVPLRMARVGEVAARLVECLPTVRTLRVIGDELAVAVAEQLSADVAVLLTRSRDAPWSVIAGEGLRPLEWRPVPRDPPVLALLDARRPILRIESSDDVRQQAVDLPCASRRHLVVARYPTIDVVVTAGRDDPTFVADDVRALGRLLQRERGWDDALMMCELAESLLPYLDT